MECCCCVRRALDTGVVEGTSHVLRVSCHSLGTCHDPTLSLGEQEGLLDGSCMAQPGLRPGARTHLTPQYRPSLGPGKIKTRSESESAQPGSESLLQVSVCLSAVEDLGVIFFSSSFSSVCTVRTEESGQVREAKRYLIRPEECIFPYTLSDDKIIN